MAVSSVVLDIRANTERALNDFKRFSSQLDNKFLVSGLKLDVVRSALGQINREFQKAIGEQGLQAGMSLKAAENQAAAILDVFKSVGPEASKAITEQFSTAFSQIAVKAGGTSEDIKKALSATSFISTNLSDDVRKSIATGIMDVQRDFRRSGLGDDFGGVMKKFLAGEVNAGQMLGSGDAMQVMLGNELMRKSGTIDTITNAEQRSRYVNDLVNDPKFTKTLNEMAKQAYGFRATIEDLSTYLFNPKEGVFGALKEVTMSIGDKTSVFKETGVLVESVFGRQGLFVNFFKQIGKIFGIEDPLKVIIIGIRFITRQFDKLNAFIQSPEIQGIVKKLQEAFNTVKDFATSLYNSVTETFSNPIDIDASIKGIGKQIREFIENVGKSIRDADVEEQGTKFLNTFTIIVGEVAQTLGTAIKEAILVVFSGKGLAVLGGAVKVLYEGLSKFFTGLFGGNQGAGAVLGGAAMAALGVLFFRRIRGALESILMPINAMRRGGGGAGGFINRLLGGGRGDRNLEGGRMGFQAQVIARMDAIIRILGGYAGPSSPLEDGNTDPRRGRRGGGGRGGDDGGGVDSDGGRRRGGGRSRRVRGRTQYSGSIGPLPRGSAEPWTWADDDYQPYMDADRSDARGRSTRQRFNSRYGSGGRRALMGRRFRGFGKGALIAGGIGLAGAALFGGGSAQASELDPSTSQPQVGAGEAFGRVGMGAAEGALTGAMFGPWGAAIGGVIGGGVALMDKGVRDAIGKSIGQFATNVGNNTRKLWDGLVSNVMKTFDGIKSFASSIDWKTILINAFVPGGNMAINGLQGIAEFASKLSIFDGIKSGIDGIKGIVDGIRERLPPFLGGGKTNYAGSNFMGPALAQESRMSGAKALVVNETEFVIPKNGFSTLANLVEQRISPQIASKSSSGGGVSANFNITIQVNGNIGAGDVEALRAPVLRIVEEAWASATQGTVSRGSMA